MGAALLVARAGAALGGTGLDGLGSAADWTAIAGPHSSLELSAARSHKGGGLELAYRQAGAQEAMVLRRRLKLTLPDNYAFILRWQGTASAYDVEFRVLDRDQRNVWWLRRYGLGPADAPVRLEISRHDLGFAWGPATGEPIRQLGAVELVITPRGGGSGWFRLEQLRLEERPPAYTGTPAASASASRPGHPPDAVLHGRGDSDWTPAKSGGPVWLQLDFGQPREYGGVTVHWQGSSYARRYRVERSDDGRRWETVYRVRDGNGGSDPLPLPHGCSRYLRLVMEAGGRDLAIRTLQLEPPEASDPNRYLADLAKRSAAGAYPRYWLGRQSYYTVIGADGGDPDEALLDVDGNLETGKAGFIVEPFVHTDGKLWTWADGEANASLMDGYLPIPSVTRQAGPWALSATAWTGEIAPGAASLFARYRLTNRGDRPLTATLFLALRPFQAVPPWQSLNMDGGVSPIHSLRWDDHSVWVNGERRVLPLTGGAAFGAADFDREPLATDLSQGRLPPDRAVEDASGYATGVLGYRLRLNPGEGRDIDLAMPFRPSPAIAHRPDARTADATLRAAADHWRTSLNGVELKLPDSAPRLADGMRAGLAQLLIHRDRASLQPGSRNYDRTWIRDGAAISSALLQTGHAAEVREFLEWFGGMQFPDGRIPCCADHRGADEVVENDSDGEFIYALAEYHRFSGDDATARKLWPRVAGAASHIEQLRAQRMTAEYQDGERRAYFGLVPESISHEGYGGHPVHAFWDDFWTLRGLKDAHYLAGALGDREAAARYGRLKEAFAGDVYRALAATMEQHGIAYIPASVELADFDSNAIAQFVNAIGEQHKLPQQALGRTFDDWHDYFLRRKTGRVTWDSYTPYEVRLVEALVRLGRREQALELLDWLLAGQRPPGWHQWAEVVWRDPANPAFLGDMPHGWIGAEYIRSVLSLFAYERESDQALVLAAGIPAGWVESPGGVAIRGLRTPYGTLDYTLTAPSPGLWRLQFSGNLAMPPGKLVVALPGGKTIRQLEVNGRPVLVADPNHAVIAEFPAEAVLRLGE